MRWVFQRLGGREYDDSVPGDDTEKNLPRKGLYDPLHRRYFQHAHFIPIVGVGKRGEY